MQSYDTNSYNDTYSSATERERLSSATGRSPKKKKPATVTLVSAVVCAVIAFILGFVISSSVMSDSRVENANSKNVELQAVIDEKTAEIDSLRKELDEKTSDNITLGEQIQAHLKTIDNLQSNVQNLETDVQNIADTALNGVTAPTAVAALASLSMSQQLILLIVLLVVIIFIISVTCGFIASVTNRKPSVKKPAKIKKHKKDKKAQKDDLSPDTLSEPAENTDENSDDDVPSESDDTSTPENDEKSDDSLADLGATKEFSFDNAVNEAIDLLYHNNLEDNISSIGGFKFGITNFEEILSDKAKSKSFGNTENGDFVAFMSTKTPVKKLYIIPRYMSLSDSSVALRGTTDLFDVFDEADKLITHGTVKIKTIDSPAVFAFGPNGWHIESKGHITALGTNH